MCKRTLLIDLDGVLNEYSGNYNPNFIPTIKSGAFNFLKKMYSKYDLKIFTTRNSQLTEKWLVDNKINHFVNGVTNQKIPAWLIIDDRCITFSGNYDVLVEKIDTFKPWYK